MGKKISCVNCGVPQWGELCRQCREAVGNDAYREVQALGRLEVRRARTMVADGLDLREAAAVLRGESRRWDE